MTNAARSMLVAIGLVAGCSHAAGRPAVPTASASNTFVNTDHAVAIQGRNVHFLGSSVRDMGRGNPVDAGATARDTGFVTGADGVRLFYRLEGRGPDTVIVLHGGPALGLAYLAPDLEPLGQEHALLFYDQRGVGRSWSERDVDLSVDRHIEDLEALRSHFGIGRLRLVGHSWGAMLAARYAAAYPERVERMLFIDPMVPAKAYEAEAGSGALRLMQERLDSVSLAVLDSLVRAAPEAPDPRGHCRKLFELLVPLYFPDPAAAHRARADFCAGSDQAIRARPHVNAAIMSSLLDDVRLLLYRVRSPVLIVHGSSGAIPTEAMHAWTDAFPDARLMVIPDAGHYLHVDRPDVFFPAALEFLGGGWPAGANVQSAEAGATWIDTVHVALPTGEGETDRASILAALDRVQPGGMVQFAPGTYLVGKMIRVSVPRVTLLGHAEGTTLRGCDAEDFAEMERSMELCNGLELAGARQTVRGLTFENAFWALHLGCCYDERSAYDFPDGTTHELPLVRHTEGGHLIEGNTFRSSSSGIRVNGGWTEPAIVRGNRFIDNWHAISINGHTVHVLENHFSVPQPARVPHFGFAWDAIKIAPPMPIRGETGPPGCIGNVIAGNTIEGYLDGIRVEVYLPGSICRENVIRNNTIRVRRAHNPSGLQLRDGGDPSDSTAVGVPIALLNDPLSSGEAASDAPTFVEANIVEGNRILGAEGIGIEILRSSGNRIVNNTIEGVVAREPFPGNTVAGAPGAWQHANGSGIWISPGSDGNEIVGNTFTDIAAQAVVLEGDRNHVETRSTTDVVRDLGTGNRVSIAAAATGANVVHVAPPKGDQATDRANIIAALEKVRPGETVQFAAGTYIIGEFLTVPTPRVALLGHPEGTTLRGCDPEGFDNVEEAMVACNGLALTGERQTVRGLAFEHMWSALWVGCCLSPAEPAEGAEGPHVGGHVIEGNTFRTSINGFRVIGDSPEPVLIRDNDFIDVWHAGGVNGRTAHILDNRIAVPNPGQVPVNGFPGLALFITPYDTRLDRAFTCAGNVIAGNRVEGHPEAVAIAIFRPGASCHDNVIRDNTIVVGRARFSGSPWGVVGITDPADSTLAGVPIALLDLTGEMADFFRASGLQSAEPAAGETEEKSLIHDNLIDGNSIAGAEGLGIEIRRASRNRIVNNTITGVAVREPFPGNTLFPVPSDWRAANGAGIWVSPGSDENEIFGNTFANVASHAVVLEGDRNRVETLRASDAVRDLGAGNQVVVRTGAALEQAEPGATADSVDAFIHERMASLGIPGLSLAVLRGTEVVKAAAYGRSSLELDVPVSTATVFPYASMTKAVAATAVLRLVEGGRLSPNDRIGELIPALPEAWSGVPTGCCWGCFCSNSKADRSTITCSKSSRSGSASGRSSTETTISRSS